MKKCIDLFIMLCFPAIVFSQNTFNGGIIYGDGVAFALKAPQGWILDTHLEKNNGLPAVFYKQYESWNNAETVMYARTVAFDSIFYNNVSELITYDTLDFADEYDDAIIQVDKPIIISDSVSASVLYFGSISYGNYEYVAFLPARESCVLIAISSRTQEGLKKSFTDFHDLIKSYLFISDNVTIDDN